MQNFYNLVAGLFVLSLFVLVLKVLNFLYWKPKRTEKFLRAQGLNGNPYKPFRGDLNELGMMLQEVHSKPIKISEDFLPRVVPLFVKTFEKYGKNSFMWLGPKPSVFIWEPELIKEILVNYTVFQKPHFNALTKLLAEGLVSYECDKWAKHRKIITPAFHVEKLKRMSSGFLLTASEMLRKWEEIISPKGSGELDIWPHLQTLSSDAISLAAFGSSYEEGRKIFELQREQADNYQIVERILYIPGYRFLPTKINKRMQYIKRVVEDSIQDIIDKRVKAMKDGESCNDDLLGLLLESNYNEIQEQGDKKFGMTMNDVIKECKLFYYAGAETTSVLLVWTMVLLSKHKDWQSRAREEVLRVFGRKAPDFVGLNQLKIVTMILNETLRLYPPVASINRRVHKEAKIGQYFLPAGTLVTLPFILLHHDTDIWGDDAKEFNPARFADGISNATKGQQVAYFPFGWGPRICIGQNFSLVEAKLVLAMILQRFSFELSGSYTHAPRRIVTLQPQHGAHLVLHKLEQGEIAGSH